VLFFIAHSPVFVYHYQNKYGFEKGEEPVKQMLEIRWHGRGGQGAKTASQLLAEAAMESGSYIQAFPEYGPERAGAPIRAYTRISDDPVNIHSGVTNPDIVVVIDDSLLQSADVSEGLAGGILLVNTSMSPEEIPRFAEAVRNGAHVAKGSRFLPLAGSEDLTPLRRFGNKLMVIALNLLFSTNYTDLCYGFIAFRKDALTSLSPHLASDEFEIETEICIKARALGFRVDEVPSFERMRNYGKSNLNTFRDGFKIFSLLLREALKTK